MSTQSEPTPKKKRVHAGGVAKGYKQSPEHVAALKAKRDKIMRAKKKLGLAWKDPLPPDHPLAKGKQYDAAKQKQRRAAAKAREETLAVAQGPAKELTPAQLAKQAYQRKYRAKVKRDLAKGDPAALAAAKAQRERKRKWHNERMAAKRAGLPVEGKRANGHANGDSVIHDLLPVGKGSIGIAQVRRLMPDPMGMPAGSRAARVMGLMEAWTVILREELAKE